ncbi:2,3-bisphosphoglycerate-independent phosphoglycerate mutase [Candidatus Saccharibacteria bacterium]|nr:2,3-bisphosphoglycerate-independent phosphoglycerate mutase [Candidatus Saccharibacteria bacterium]
MSLKYEGPVVLAVLDGVGLRNELAGNAVKQAHTEFLNMVVNNYPTLALSASGTAVGVLPDDMGNSEVGHNAIGSGQIVKQGVAQIQEAFDTGAIYESKAWKEAISHATKKGATLHFAGILSNGNVHSSIYHLEKMIDKAHSEGVKKIRIHAVLDGRDTPPQSADQYVSAIEALVNQYPDHPDYRFASGGGRMIFVADRYENDWGVVKAGWDAIVHAEAPYQFSSALEAISTFRAGDPNIQDQYIPPFVICENGKPVGKVKNGDAFIYFDFRADRAIEIAQAFTYNDFPYFDRGDRPDVYFVGMTEYNSDTHVPEHRLVEPIKISNTLSEVLSHKGLKQLAVAETVKFGHITYYFNGNSYEKFPGEEQVEIPSDTVPFDTRPWMKSAETADVVIRDMKNYDFVRLNFAGGDMVGHFAELEPTITALEAIDIQLARIAREVDALGGILLVTADHGNAEELVDAEGNPKTAHTTNLVPLIFYDNTKNREKYNVIEKLADSGYPGLSNIAPTVANLLGIDELPESWNQSLISAKE